MSIIAVVRELPGCSVSGCVGVAVARCSTAKEKKENKNVNNYLHLGPFFRSPEIRYQLSAKKRHDWSV